MQKLLSGLLFVAGIAGLIASLSFIGIRNERINNIERSVKDDERFKDSVMERLTSQQVDIDRMRLTIGFELRNQSDSSELRVIINELGRTMLEQREGISELEREMNMMGERIKQMEAELENRKYTHE